MSYFVVKGGALKEATNIEVVKDGVLTQANKVEVVDNNQLVTVWQRTPPVDLSGVPDLIQDTPSFRSGIVGYYVYADGTHKQRIYNTYTDLTPDWLDRGSNTDYEINFDMITSPKPAYLSGSVKSDTWYGMTSNFFIAFTTQFSTTECDIIIRVRNKSTLEEVTTKQVKFKAL